MASQSPNSTSASIESSTTPATSSHTTLVSHMDATDERSAETVTSTQIDGDTRMVTSSLKLHASATPVSSTTLGLIKCPTYCRSNCIIQHHPLLVAILNCLDTEQMDLMEMKLSILKNVITKYQQNLNWKTADVIPDVVEYYRYPMIHWACTLGRVAAAVWLVGHGISDPKTRAISRKCETGLHRALMCLQETCPNCAGHKFVQLLSVMEPALSIPDKDGNTPIHVCCEMLRINIPRSDFYSQALFSMLVELNKARDVKEVKNVLNMQNNDGDTALHLLSENGKHTAAIKVMIKMGANHLLNNKMGLTPVKIAEIGGNYNLLVFYTHCLDGTGLSVEAHCVSNDILSPRTEVSEQQRCEASVQQQLYPFNTAADINTAAADINTAAADINSQIFSVPTVFTEFESTEIKEKKMKMSQMKSCDQHQDVDMSKYSDKIDMVFDSQLNLKAIDVPEHSRSILSSLLTESNTSPEQISPSIIFEGNSLEDLAAQKFFEEVVDPSDKESTDKVHIQTKPITTEADFFELVKSITSTKNNEFLKPALSMETILEYLHKMKDLNLHCDFLKNILLLRDKELSNLRHSYRSISGLKRKFRETQTQQDKQVSEIMVIVDSLSQLQNEEQNLLSGIDVLKKKTESAWQSKLSLQERLHHCNQAIDVLKQLQKENKIK